VEFTDREVPMAAYSGSWLSKIQEFFNAPPSTPSEEREGKNAWQETQTKCQNIDTAAFIEIN
jgi:hypothetical protein